MKHSYVGTRAVACALALSALLSGCNDSVPSSGSPTPPASVAGIATPSSVAVVTATNAD